MTTPFTFETVDDGTQGGVHGELSLALDKQGNPRVAYAQPSGAIMLARRDSGAWTLERLPSGSNVALIGERICLAIDSNGNPHLAYRDLTGGDLIHAVKTGSDWTFNHVVTLLTPVGGGGVDGVAFALHPGRLDPSQRDVPFFAYTDLATGGLGFAHSGIGPSPVAVDIDHGPTRTEFGHASATFDPSEGFFFAYVGSANLGAPNPQVSVRSAFVVDIEQGTISQVQTLEQSESINVISTGLARTAFEGCIAYFDLASKTVKSQFLSPDVPRSEIIETNINSGPPSAAQNGAIAAPAFRVAYADANAVKLASRNQFGDWTVEIVDPVSGISPSLAYDNSGTAHLAYAAGGKLKYARRSE